MRFPRRWSWLVKTARKLEGSRRKSSIIVSPNNSIKAAFSKSYGVTNSNERKEKVNEEEFNNPLPGRASPRSVGRIDSTPRICCTLRRQVAGLVRHPRCRKLLRWLRSVFPEADAQRWRRNRQRCRK